MTSVLVRERQRGMETEDTEERRPRDKGGRDGAGATKDGRQPPEARREAWSRFLTLTPISVLDFWPPNHEKVQSCCSKPHWPWELVTATETNTLFFPTRGSERGLPAGAPTFPGITGSGQKCPSHWGSWRGWKTLGPSPPRPQPVLF